MAKREKLEEYVGLKFTYLTVIKEGKPHITSGGFIRRTLYCECKCGTKKDFQFSSIKSGFIKSCGCYSAKINSERMKTQMKTHGLTLTSEYNAWSSMKKRCLKTNHKSYKDYGGRGIFIEEDWVNSFECFLKDMGKKPNKNYSLDRINNNIGYSKENCKWSTKKEQSRNVRNNVMVEYKGETKCLSEWSEIIGINRNKLNYRIFTAKWCIEKAMTYGL